MKKASVRCKEMMRRNKFPFLAALAIGLCTHFFAMTHNLLTYDSLWNIYSDQNMISSGRQFLTFACGVSSFYNLPWVNGLLALIYLALTTCAVVYVFDVNDKLSMFLIAGILVTFPSVTATFCYAFTVDGYMLGLFMAVMAYYLATKYKWGFAFAIPILGISLGIYQAYMSATIILCILGLTRDLLSNDKFKNLLIRGIKYVGMGIGAYVFYVVTLKIMLKAEHIELSGYQGSDKVGSLDFAVIPTGLKTAFKSSIGFLIHSGVLTQNIFMKISLVAIVLLTAYFTVRRLMNFKGRELLWRTVSVIALICMIPFAMSYVAILSPDIFYHVLLRMAVFVLFVFPFVIGTDIKEKVSLKILYITTAIMIFSFIISANICYFNLNERYEKTYAMSVRLVERLEATPEYHVGDSVAILGGFPGATNYPSTDITAETLVGFFGVDGDYCANSTEKYAEFMKHYLGVTIHTIDYAKELEIAASEEYADMKPFPSAESIKRIDGVWVIRLND